MHVYMWVHICAYVCTHIYVHTYIRAYTGVKHILKHFRSHKIIPALPNPIYHHRVLCVPQIFICMSFLPRWDSWVPTTSSYLFISSIKEIISELLHPKTHKKQMYWKEFRIFPPLFLAPSILIGFNVYKFDNIF